jgi:hypothetical protein
MPSRLGIVAIVVFWLVGTTWLVVREVVPRFRTGVPPGFVTDVTDEFGGTTITWDIRQKQLSIGTGLSRVERRLDRTFVLTTDLRFDNLHLAGLAQIKEIWGSYQVDTEGKLKQLKTEVRVVLGPLGEVKGEVKAVVQDGLLVARIFLNGVDKTDLIKPQPVNVGAHGNILNTMHLVNKVPGLYMGRSWKLPLFDPLGAILPGQKMTPATLIAEVTSAPLDWHDKQVPCFRIDYAEPGAKASAHTWVRQSDGLVLQQQAIQGGMDLVLVRESAK